MMQHKLIDGVTTTTVGAGVPVAIRNVRSRDEILLQVAIGGGSATVAIYGRLSRDLPWVTITTINSDAITPIARVAEVKAEVTSIAGATVDCVVFID